MPKAVKLNLDKIEELLESDMGETALSWRYAIIKMLLAEDRKLRALLVRIYEALPIFLDNDNFDSTEVREELLKIQKELGELGV